MRGPTHRHRRLPSRRAFTLLELIVVLVVLGLIAAIAIPTYRGVVDRAQDKVTLASVSSVLRATSANAAVEGRHTFLPSDLETAGAEVGELEAASVPGEFAADASWVMSLDPDGHSAEYGQLHAGLSADSRLAGLAAVSPTGRCAFARNAVGGRVEAWISAEPLGEDCSAPSAILGVEHPDDPNPPAEDPSFPPGAPGIPILNFAEAGDQYLFLTWLMPADEGTSPVTHFTLEVDGPNYDIDVTVPRSSLDPAEYATWVESGYMDWGSFDLDTFDPDVVEFLEDAPEVVNDEPYTLTVAAVNAAGAGPALVEELTPGEQPEPPQLQPDPPIILTETVGLTDADPGDEQLWIDATWDPPEYTGTEPLTGYWVTFEGPNAYYQQFVGVDEARHARVEGSIFTSGDEGSETVQVGLVPEDSYYFRVTAVNENGASEAAWASFFTPTLPVYEPPAFTAQDPTDITGATDGGWPAVQQVIVYPLRDTNYFWKAFRLGGGVADVRVTDVQWSFDGGATWGGEGPLGVTRGPHEDLPAYSYDPEMNGGPYHLHRSGTFECGTPNGLGYAPQMWDVHSAYVNPYVGDHGSGLLGSITDRGNGRIDVSRIGEPYPINSENGEVRQRIRYTYNNLSGPGLGEGTAVVIHHPTRALTSSTPVSAFPSTPC